MALRNSLIPQPHLYMGDMQGRPLDAGKVYFGEPNKDPEFYPINVFYDESLTIPAAQPIRTMGGFMNASGQMVQVYALEKEYSVKVLDGYGREVFYQPFVDNSNAELDAVKLDTGITATAKLGGINRTQAEKNKDIYSPKDFGCVGDGVTDDAEGILKAGLAGVKIDWGDAVYAHSGVDMVVDSVNWVSNGAKFLYIGDYAKTAFKLTIIKNSTIAGSMYFDANSNANEGLVIFCGLTELTTTTSRPNLSLGVIGSYNVYRKHTGFTGGDAIFIGGAFGRLSAETVRIKGAKMAVGADVFASQGIFGLTIAANNSYRVQNIDVANLYVENVWSEDANYKSDQDGLRIFQDLTDPYSYAHIGRYDCINVASRAIKLHSSPNCVIGYVHRVLDSNVVPQSGKFNTADIDCQQSACVVNGVNFLYDGVYHSALIQHYNKLSTADVALAIVSNVKGVVRNVDASNMSIVSLQPSDDSSSYYAAISNITVSGGIGDFVRINLRTAGSSSLTLTNATGLCKIGAVQVLGSTTAALSLSVSNITNVSSAVPLSTKTAPSFKIKDVNCTGFSGTSLNTASVSSGGIGTATWTQGSEAPEGVQNAVRGSIYSQTTGALFVKVSGSYSTGWKQVTLVA